MTQKITNLMPSGEPVKALRASDLIRRPGHLICPDGVVFHDLERVVQRHLLIQTVPSLMEGADRFLVIQGPPGSSKTVTACDGCLRYGWAVLSLPMAQLAGESEGAASDALRTYFEEAVAYSKASGFRVAVVADDADLSILATSDAGAKIGRTINSALLANEIQRLADRPKPYRNSDHSIIPLIMTGNDFTSVRSSLTRDGRATRYTHTPSYEEKIHLAFHVLAPRSRADLHLVEKVVRTYRRQPIAFWPALRDDIRLDQLNQLMGRNVSDPATIEAHIAGPVPLDPDRVWALAKARAGSTVTSFLAPS